jgi:endonuclease/exonuclease/phosphatase family metal-dependent hydrolase
MPSITPNAPLAHPLAPNPHTSVGLIWVYTDPNTGRQWTEGTYKIKRSTGAGSTPTTVIASGVASVVNGLPRVDFQDFGPLTPNTTYGYRIVATDGTGDSADSPTVYVTTTATADGMVHFPNSIFSNLLGPQPEASQIPFSWYNSVAASQGQDVISKYPVVAPGKLLGTVAINNGSTTLTGTGTKFLEQVSANNPTNAPSGYELNHIYINGIDAGTIASVVSNTQITLTSPWSGTTISSGGSATTNGPGDPLTNWLTGNQVMYYDSPMALWQEYFRTGDPQYVRGAIKGSESLFAGFLWLGRNRAWQEFSTVANNPIVAPRNFQFSGYLLLGLAGHVGVWDLLDKYLTDFYAAWLSNYRNVPAPNFTYVREKAYMILFTSWFIMSALDSFPRSDGSTTSLNGTITVDGSLATGRKGFWRDQLNIDVPGFITTHQNDSGLWYDHGGSNETGDGDYPQVGGVAVGPAQPFIQGLTGDALGYCWRNTALSTTARNAARRLVLKSAAAIYHVGYNVNINPSRTPARHRNLYYFVDAGTRLHPLAFQHGGDSYMIDNVPYTNVAVLNRQANPLAMPVYGWAHEMAGASDSRYLTMGDELANAAFAEIGENTGGTADGLKSLADNDANYKDYGQSFRCTGRYFGDRLLAGGTLGTKPVVTMPSDVTLTNGVNQVDLTASVSVTNGPATYRWVLKEYALVNNPRHCAQPVFTSTSTLSTKLCGLESGVYKVLFYAIDSLGLHDYGIVTVTVGDGVFPPTVAIGYGNPPNEEMSQYLTTSSTLSGSVRAYSAAAGRQLNHAFSVRGPKDKTQATLTPNTLTGNVVTFNITGLSAGLWIVTDTVTDSAGAQRKAVMYIRHTAEAQPSAAHNTIPDIVATPNHTIPESSTSTQLLVVPLDPEGIANYTSSAAGYVLGMNGGRYIVTALTHNWSQISGPSTATITNGTTISPTLTNLAASGTYVFRYTGTDQQGDTVVKDVTVTKLGTTQDPGGGGGGGGGGTNPTTRGIIFNGTTQHAKVLLPNTSPWNAMGAHKVVFRARALTQQGILYQIGTTLGSQRLICGLSSTPARVDWDDFTGNQMFMPPTEYTDFIGKVQFDPVNGRWTFETWRTDGSGRVERLVNVSYTTVNYGGQDLWFAINESLVNRGAFKLDWWYMQSGSDALNVFPGAEPTVGTTLLRYDFENNGNDISGNGLNLTLSGTPTFEDTPSTGGSTGGGTVPVTVVTDTFTGSDSTNLQSHPTNSAHTWFLHPAGLANAVISGNKLTKDSSASTALYYNNGVIAADQYVQANITRMSALAGVNVSLTLRMSTTVETDYRARHNADTNEWSIRKTVNGTPTVLGTWTETLNAGDSRLARFEAIGSTLKLYIAGVERISVVDTSIASGVSGLRLTGAASGSTGYSVDNYEAGSFVTGTVILAPSNLILSTPARNKVVLNWVSNSNNETGFKIERKVGAVGAYSEINSVSQGVTTFEDTTVTEGVVYYYRVRASNLTGTSAYCAEEAIKTPATNVTPVRVVSYNMQFMTGTDEVHNIDRLATWVTRFNPDLVAGCECPVEDVSTFKSLMESKTGLVWYTFHIGKTPGLSEGNLILSKYPILGSTGLYLSNSRSVGVVKVDINGQNVHFFATHLQNGQDSTNAAIRQQQLNELIPFINGFIEARIIAGDFNAQPASTEIATQMGAGYNSSWAIALANSSAYAYPDNPAGTNTRTRTVHIDYVFVSKNATTFSVRQAYIPDTRDLFNTNVVNVIGTTDDEGVRPSDHNPVIADLDFTSTPFTPLQPIVNAGVDKILANNVTSTTLTATASDPDGGSVSVIWTTSFGPNTPSITNSNQPTATVSGLIPGTYVFRCTVTDDEGASAFDEVVVRVNKIPTVNAGTDKSLPAGTVSTNLIATSSDPDGDSLSYLWSMLSGPNTPNIATPNAISTAITNMVAGTYNFRLTVNDGFDTVTDDIQVAIAGNVTPTVDAGLDKNLPATTTSTTLTATVNDPDGTISSVVWSKVSGPAASIQSPTTASTDVTGLVPGVYVFKCTVTDNLGASSVDNVTVRINSLPVVNAGSDQTLAQGATATTLTATISDADLDSVSTVWSRVSGPNTPSFGSENNISTTVNGMIAGTYVFRLTVNDGINPSVTDDVQISIPSLVNNPPTVTTMSNKRLPYKVTSTMLTATVSDPEGQSLTITWSRVSGPNVPNILTPNASSTQVTGLVKGKYIFRISVSDNVNPPVIKDVTIEVPNKRGGVGGGVISDGGGTGGTISTR